ncbi:29988_t:CDS:2 [Gigaspora margarita]|uniref:29988_t:CDS:1 n=1 Tax=Gigaspora margarita TaxID=4874 RepID=A0ABN7V6Z7_GIGMA|nr:29988_t:CDS:2 [Gigaspora margarita]
MNSDLMSVFPVIYLLIHQGQFVAIQNDLDHLLEIANKKWKADKIVKASRIADRIVKPNKIADEIKNIALRI